jgi:SAM-dependent methyltransferase
MTADEEDARMAHDPTVPPPVPAGAPAIDADLKAFAETHCTWCGGTGRESYPGEEGKCVWHRCTDCGFWVSSLLCDPRDYADEGYNLDYHLAYYGHALKRKLTTAHFRFNVIEALQPAKGSFLDIGPSYGYMLEAGTARGWSTHGVDLAPSIIEYAQARGLDIRLGSLTDIPFENASMDVVHARHVLEHDIETYRALAEIARVMKPGALLVCEVPDGECNRALVTPEREVLNWPYLHMVTFTPSVLAGFMARMGFERVDEPGLLCGSPKFQAWRLWKLFRENTRQATYMVTFWRRPA